MFSIASGESCPRVKFRGLGRAAGNRSPGSSPQIEHRVVKIAYHFGLPSTRFPPLCRLGKEGGVPASQWISNPQRARKGIVRRTIPSPAKACSMQTVMQIGIKSAQQGKSGLWRYKVPDDPQQNKELCHLTCTHTYN